MWIFEIIQLVIILAVSIWMHEYAHAYVSYRLGDPTPWLQWRLTPNPLKHLDPLGSIMIFIMIVSWWGIWWGKPVQINPLYYKHPRKWEALVAIAGPATNIILCVVGILVMLIYSKIAGTASILSGNDPFVLFWYQFAAVNIWLAIFNLLPIPPLDGFSLVKMIFHKNIQFIEKYSQYIVIFFLILLLWPWRTVIGNFLGHIWERVFGILFFLLWQIFY